MAVGGLFVEVGMMVVEGRMPGAAPGPPKPGPHCPQLPPSVTSHFGQQCNESLHLCARAEALRRHMSLLSESRVPMCIDVYLCSDCACGKQRAATSQPAPTDLLLEQWTITFNKSMGVQQGGSGAGCLEVDGRGLLAAIRSQLHFSQLSAWYSRHGGNGMPPVCYRLSHPAPPAPSFHRPPVQHFFPLAKMNGNNFLKVSMKALPRLDSVPEVLCSIHGCRHATSSVQGRSDTPHPPSVISPPLRLVGGKRSPPPSRPNPHCGTSNCTPAPSRPPPNVAPSPVPAAAASQAAQATITAFRTVFAELGHCLLDPPSRIPPLKQGFLAWRERRSQNSSSQLLNRVSTQPSVPPLSRPHPTSSIGMVDDRMQCGCKHIGKHHCEEPLDTEQESNNQINTTINSGCDKERRKSSGSPTLPRNDLIRTPTSVHHCNNCRERDLNRANALHGGIRHVTCSPHGVCSGSKETNDRDITPPQIILTSPPQPNPLKRKRHQQGTNNKKLLSDRSTDTLPPLTSQQLVDVFRKLYIQSNDRHTVEKQDERDLNVGVVLPVIRSPPSPLATSPLATSPLPSSPSPNKKGGWTDSSSETESESPSRPGLPLKQDVVQSVAVRRSTRLARGGPLLGSLEESLLKRRVPPSRVVTSGFTADLGASGSFCPKHLTLPVTVDFYPPMGLSTPILGSMMVGKKGYSVPRAGTIQATLLNPHGTVVKMFVVPYDLTDMPANSTTFIRQRTTSTGAANPLLRYLIHLRFSSSKSGRLYLEGEIMMLVCRQYDADATLGLDPLDSNSHLNSVIIIPDNPKYSPRK